MVSQTMSDKTEFESNVRNNDLFTAASEGGLSDLNGLRDMEIYEAGEGVPCVLVYESVHSDEPQEFVGNVSTWGESKHSGVHTLTVKGWEKSMTVKSAGGSNKVKSVTGSGERHVGTLLKVKLARPTEVREAIESAIDEDEDEEDNDDNEDNVATDDNEDLTVTEASEAVSEGDRIAVDYEIVVGEHSGEANTHEGTVTNVTRGLIQYRMDGCKDTNAVSRNGGVSVQHTFKDVTVGRNATVRVLADDEEEVRRCNAEECEEPAQTRSSYCSTECRDETEPRTVDEILDPNGEPMTDGGEDVDVVATDCPRCGGTGEVQSPGLPAGGYMETCPQCRGHGEVERPVMTDGGTDLWSTANETDRRLLGDGGVSEGMARGEVLDGACSLVNREHEIPERLAEALDSLAARAGAAGCRSCAAANNSGPLVFYVAQSDGPEERPEYIKYAHDDEEGQRRVASELVRALTRAGLGVEWGGDLNEAVRVIYPED